MLLQHTDVFRDLFLLEAHPHTHLRWRFEFIQLTSVICESINFYLLHPVTKTLTILVCYSICLNVCLSSSPFVKDNHDCLSHLSSRVSNVFIVFEMCYFVITQSQVTDHTSLLSIYFEENVYYGILLMLKNTV